MFSGGARQQQQPGSQLHAAADEPVIHDGGDVPSAGQPCPRAAQVTVDEAMAAESTGPIVAGTKADAGRQRGSNLSAAVVGVCVASSAATAITAGAAVNPAVALGFFVALLGGLSLSMASVRGA